MRFAPRSRNAGFFTFPLDSTTVLCYTITVLIEIIQLIRSDSERGRALRFAGQTAGFLSGMCMNTKGGIGLIQINYSDPRPIYEKVKESLRRLILSGALPEDSRLPSVRELAMSLTINPNTIQRAYRELEQEGCIVSVPGKGSFVARGGGAKAARRAELRERLNALAAEFEAIGVSRAEMAEMLKEEEA